MFVNIGLLDSRYVVKFLLHLCHLLMARFGLWLMWGVGFVHFGSLGVMVLPSEGTTTEMGRI